MAPADHGNDRENEKVTVSLLAPSLDRSISFVLVLAIRTGIAGRADIKLSNTKRNCSNALIVRQQGIRKTCLG